MDSYNKTKGNVFTQGIVPRIDEMGKTYAGEESEQGARQTRKKSTWSPWKIDKPNVKPNEKTREKPKEKSKEKLQEERLMVTTDLLPMNIEEQVQAEHQRRLLEAQKVAEQEKMQKQHINSPSAEEGYRRTDRIKTLETGVDEISGIYLGKRSDLGAGRTRKKISWMPAPMDKPKDMPKEKPKEKAKTLTETPNEGSETFMSLAELAPLSLEQQAERNRKLLEAQKVIQEEMRKTRHTNCISPEEGLLRQNKINRLESELEVLRAEVVALHDQVGKYRKLTEGIGPLFQKLRPGFQSVVDPKTGQQPPEWTLAYCLQQFETLEMEKMRMEDNFQVQLRDLAARYQQEKNKIAVLNELEKQNLHVQVTNVINVCEELKRDMTADDNGDASGQGDAGAE